MVTEQNTMGDKNLRISIVSFSTEVDQLKSTFASVAGAARNLADKTGVQSKIIIVNNKKGFSIDPEMFRESIVEGDVLRPHIIDGHGNVGYGRGHNLAIDSDSGGYHLILNPDVDIDQQAVEVGIAYLEAHREIGMVSPYAEGRDGRKQHLCKRYPSVFDLCLRGLMPQSVKFLFSERLARYEMQELSENTATSGIPIAGGCFMLCRNSVLAEIGGFDSRYFLYFEDFDLSLRLGAVADIAYLPKMRIKHLGGQTSKKGLWHILMFVRSGLRFFSTHGWRWF